MRAALAVASTRSSCVSRFGCAFCLRLPLLFFIILLASPSVRPSPLAAPSVTPINAIVLSDDKHVASAKLMLHKYQLLWPRAPLRFFVPFNSVSRVYAQRAFAEYAHLVTLVQTASRTRSSHF